MSFTVTTQSVATRREKLRLVQQLVNELIQINESVARTATQLEDQGESAAEIANTCNKTLSGGGTPFVSAATDLSLCTGDTISDRIVNILSSNTGGIGWSHPTS